MARRPKKTMAGMNFVGEQIRAGRVFTSKEVQEATKLSQAQTHRVIQHFRDLDVLAVVKRGQYASRSVAQRLVNA